MINTDPTTGHILGAGIAGAFAWLSYL